MTEPTIPVSAGMIALGVALFGTMAGPYAVLLLSALAGALWALSVANTAGPRAGALLVLRLVLTAVALTGGLAWWLESSYQWPAQHTVGPIAFAIALGKEGRRALLSEVRELRAWWRGEAGGS